MSEMQMGQGFAGVIDRVRAEGQLTRNSGTNSLKRLTDTVNIGNELTVDAFSDLNNMMETKLDMLSNILSLESNETGLARMQAQDAAMKAEAFYMNLLQLNKQGVDNTEALAAAQESMFEEQRKANELSEKRGLFDRLDDKEPTAVEKETGKSLTDSGTSLMDTFKKIRNRFLALGAVIGLAAGALLAVFDDAYNSISKTLDDFIDGNFAKGFARIGNAFDTALTNALKKGFGLEFEGQVSDVIKRFIGSFLAGIADLLPDVAFFNSLREKLFATSAELDPQAGAAREAAKISSEAELARLDLGEDDSATISEQEKQVEEAATKRLNQLVLELDQLRKGEFGPEEVEALAENERRIKKLQSQLRGSTDEVIGKPIRDVFELITKGPKILADTIRRMNNPELENQKLLAQARAAAGELPEIESLTKEIEKLNGILAKGKDRVSVSQLVSARDKVDDLQMQIEALRENEAARTVGNLVVEPGVAPPMIQNNVDASNNTGGATNIQSNGKPTNNQSSTGALAASTIR